MKGVLVISFALGLTGLFIFVGFVQSGNSANVIYSVFGHNSDTSGGEITKSTELFEDIEFNDGVYVKSPRTVRIITGDTHELNGIICPVYKESWNKYIHELNFNNKRDGVKASWDLAQWSSKANLWPPHGSSVNEGAFKWENKFKKLILGKLGSGYRYLTLGVNGQEEYRNKWGRSEGICFETPHPAMLMGQKFDFTEDPSLGDMDKLNFTFSSKVTKNTLAERHTDFWEKHMNEYTSHFKIHINISNLRTDKDFSKGHGQGFGIGINYFDVRNRNRDYVEKVFFHRPQQRIMLNLAIDDLNPDLRTKLHKGQWGSINAVDLLPHIERAFAIAIKEGKADDSVNKLISEDLGDYYVNSMNFGWEVSSLHNVEMHISDVSLEAVH